jgi:hypothetical protein
LKGAIDTEYLKIGSYTPETKDTHAIIKREYYRQGWIFKDGEAYENHKDKPCYVSEYSDGAYTKRDFINLCGGNKEFADECFEIVDWQMPETWIDEQFTHREWDACPKCGYLYSLYDVEHGKTPPVCVKCKANLNEESENAK